MLVRFPQPLVISEYFNYDRFGEIVLALRLGQPERMPEPATEAILGVALPLLAADPFEISAPAKLSRALEVFDAAHNKRI